MSETKQTLYAIDAELANQLIVYLGRQPWSAVNALVTGLQSMQPIGEPVGAEAEVDEEKGEDG